DEAREIGEKALAINNHDARVYGILTDANVELGNYDEAVIMADSMVATRPDLRSYSRISYLREIYGEVEGAQEAMMMAVKAGYPGHEETSWSRVTLGNLYETYGDLTRADVQYRTAIQNRRGYPFAIAGLASVEAKKGNMAEATGLLKKAIDIRPEAGFYEQLALLYKQQGDEDNAAKAGEKAMETLKGLSGEHQHDHGDHSHRDGEHTHGQNEHGHSHEVGLEMAKMLVSLQQDYEEALHHGLHEYSRRPDNIEVNKLLAEVYYKTGRIKQASEHYEKAMVTNTKDPKLMMLGGLIKMADGQSAEGKKMILKSFEINPYQTGPIASESKSKIGQGKRSLNT
ncbi:MAG: tetratricopeptide repeat protein, partial [Owenweeksia sp.]